MKMNNIKMVEIRDIATLIPAFAIRMLPSEEEELFLMKRSGYGIFNPCVMLIPINAPWESVRCAEEQSKDGGRTLFHAHNWIEKNFDKIENCQVVDVEFILGEVEKPCVSERFEIMSEVIKGK